MNDFLNRLFENRKQKVAWALYIIALVLNWLIVLDHNAITFACRQSGHNCWSLSTSSLLITIIFVVITSILRDRRAK